MSPDATAAEVMARVRHEVCANCPLRPEGGPPCAPLGRKCAIELHPEELIEMVRTDRDHNLCEAVDRALYLLDDQGPVS